MAEDKKEHRTISEEYAEMAQKIIQKEFLLTDIRHSEATIIYLSSDKPKTSKGRAVCGECEKIPDKYKWAIPADFTITIYDPNVVTFTKEQMEILLFHELLHVGIELQGDGSEKYSVRPHDIEDFKEIVRRYGIDWDAPQWEAIDGTGEEGQTTE